MNGETNNNVKREEKPDVYRLAKVVRTEIIPNLLISAVVSGVPLLLFLLMKRLFPEADNNGMLEYAGFFFGIVGCELVEWITLDGEIRKAPALTKGIGLFYIGAFSALFAILYSFDFANIKLGELQEDFLECLIKLFGWTCVGFCFALKTCSAFYKESKIHG